MLSRKTKTSTKSRKEELEERRYNAAVVIQCLVRKFVSRRRMKAMAIKSWQRVYDPRFKLYFW